MVWSLRTVARSANDCGGVFGADHLVARMDGVDPHVDDGDF